MNILDDHTHTHTCSKATYINSVNLHNLILADQLDVALVLTNVTGGDTKQVQTNSMRDTLQLKQ